MHLAPAFGEVDRVGRASSSGSPRSTPSARTAGSPRRSRGSQGQGVRDANEQIVAELERRGALVARRVARPLGPALLALQRRAHLLGQAQLVRRHDAPQGRPAARERGASTGTPSTSATAGSASGWRTTSTGRCRATATGGRRCPIWRCADGPRHLRRARAPSSPSSPAPTSSSVDPHRPAIDEVTFACPVCATTATRVAPVIDAWFDSGRDARGPVGLPARRGLEGGLRVPRRVHRRGDRPDARLVLLPARGQHARLRRDAVPPRAVPRPHRRRGRPQDVQVARQRDRPLGGARHPRVRTPLRWWMFSQGSPWTPTRGSLAAIDASIRDTLLTLWNTYCVLHDLRVAQRLRPGDADGARPARHAPELDRWVLSRLERDDACGDRGARRLRAARRQRRPSRRWSTTSPTGTCGAPAARFWRTDPDAPRVRHARRARDAARGPGPRRGPARARSARSSPTTSSRGCATRRPTTRCTSCDWPVADAAAIDEALEAQMAVGARARLARPRGARRGRDQGPPAAAPRAGLPAPGRRRAAGRRSSRTSSTSTTSSTPTSSPTSSPTSCTRTSESLGPRLGERAQGASATRSTRSTPWRRRARSKAGGTVTVELGGERRRARRRRRRAARPRRGGLRRSRARAPRSSPSTSSSTTGCAAAASVRELVRQIQELRKERGLRGRRPRRAVARGLDARRRDERDLRRREVLADAVHDGRGRRARRAPWSSADGLAATVVARSSASQLADARRRSAVQLAQRGLERVALLGGQLRACT